MPTVRKRSGRIPAFGEWEKADGLPITQYFESARQAGLVRFSGEYKPAGNGSGAAAGEDLYGGGVRDFHQAPPHYRAPAANRKGKCNKGCPQYTKGQKRAVGLKPMKNIYDSHKQFEEQISFKCKSDINVKQQRSKPVDEDLYTVPNELLQHDGHRKKVFGFFSRCLAPPCIA